MGHSPNPLNLFPMLFLCEYTIFGSSYCQLSSHLRICSSWCLQDLRSALAHEEPSLTQHPSFILQDAGSGNVLKDDAYCTSVSLCWEGKWLKHTKMWVSPLFSVWRMRLM